ncbi:unnamed protein product [Adineta steineri]|uniref:TAFH domain-containing protein n=1 Tax=Adineta steineri TaxID=433720 RepID=A0A813RXL4_9BILA|nr:unnamed protein product [Adineta steineri]CAF0941149.1 unnamed protein product [Adineta steineri]
MTSSPSPFANTGKLQVLPNPTTLLFTPSMNNNVTINNMSNTSQNIRQTNTQNGTILQQQMNSGMMTTPTNIVRVNQPQTMQHQQQQQQQHGQFVQQTVWTSNNNPQHQFTLQKQSQQSSVFQYATVKNEPGIPIGMQQQSSVIPTKVITQPVVRQTVGSQQATTTTYTESQINDFVSKCRTFLTTLLRLAEKQAPEKLPMVRSCIQELLDGSIDPESFTQRLHTLYKSQPHTSLVPFFKLALPHMRQIVKNTFKQPITIDLLEKLQLPPSNTNNNNTTGLTQITNSNVIINSQQQHQQIQQQLQQHQQQQQQQQNSSPIIQQPLYTTVQPQQKINILQQNPQQTFVGSTASLLSQQQQRQQQARAQISITGFRPLVTSLSPSGNTSLLSGGQQQQQVQPVTQMIIQQNDSLLQRSILSGATTIQQPQIITVNQQPIKTETIHTHPSPIISSIQQKPIIKTENDLLDDSNNSGMMDTRHITHDDRLIPANMLQRRLQDLIEKDKRLAGMMVTDDASFVLISNAAQERLKFLLEQVKLVAQHRIDISMKNDSAYQQTSDVKGQIRFLEDLDKIEKQKKDKLEQEKILRAAKSRSKTNDPEAVKLKQKAKEMQQAQVEEQRQKEANETALAAIGKPKKRKLEESTNHPHQVTTSTNGPEQISPIQPSPSSNTVTSTNVNSKSKATKRICRANLRDLLLIMERDKYLKRTTLLVKALNK